MKQREFIFTATLLFGAVFGISLVGIVAGGIVGTILLNAAGVTFIASLVVYFLSFIAPK